MPYRKACLAALHNFVAVHACKKLPKGQHQEPKLLQATIGTLAEFAGSWQISTWAAVLLLL